MNASALERLELESDLRHALEQNEFVLYYQPQFSGDGKRLTGTEALLRWRHPRRGLVPPGDFIPGDRGAGPGGGRRRLGDQRSLPPAQDLAPDQGARAEGRR